MDKECVAGEATAITRFTDQGGDTNDGGRVTADWATAEQAIGIAERVIGREGVGTGTEQDDQVTDYGGPVDQTGPP
jgi:hypothetical protein